MIPLNMFTQSFFHDPNHVQMDPVSDETESLKYHSVKPIYRPVARAGLISSVAPRSAAVSRQIIKAKLQKYLKLPKSTKLAVLSA